MVSMVRFLTIFIVAGGTLWPARSEETVAAAEVESTSFLQPEGGDGEEAQNAEEGEPDSAENPVPKEPKQDETKEGEEPVPEPELQKDPVPVEEKEPSPPESPQEEDEGPPLPPPPGTNGAGVPPRPSGPEESSSFIQQKKNLAGTTAEGSDGADGEAVTKTAEEPTESPAENPVRAPEENPADAEKKEVAEGEEIEPVEQPVMGGQGGAPDAEVQEAKAEVVEPPTKKEGNDEGAAEPQPKVEENNASSFLEQKKRNLRGNSRKSRVYSQQQMTLSSASAAATQNQKPVKRNLRGSMLRFFLTKERVSSTSGRSAGRHGTRTTAPGRAAANETVLELSSGRGRVAPEQEKSVGSLALLRAAKGRSSATTSNATTATLFSFTFSAPPKKLYPCWLIVAFYVDDFYSESAKRGLIQLLEETENMNCQLHLLVKDDDFLLQPETTAATASTTSTALRHLSAAKFREGGPCDHFVGAQAGRFWAGRSDVTATRWSGGGRVVCTEQPNNGRETASFANYTYEKYDEIQALYPLQTSPSERLGPSAITMDEEQEVARNRSASASPYLRLHYLPFPGFDHNRIDTIRNAFRQDPLSVGKSRAYFNHYNFPSAHLEDPSVDYLADAGSFLIAEYDGHKIARARFRPPVSPSGTIVDPMNLRSWYESWIREPAWEQAGNYFSGMKGAQSTTSVLLLQRKKELYREVGQECSTGGSFGNEAGMFVERLMPVIFGYGAENKATEYEDTTSLQNELPNIKTSADRSIVQRIFANVKF